MARGGRTRDRDVAERRCIVTRETGPKAGLLRFVAGPDGTLVPDLAGRLPGRGIWVSATREALETAQAKGLFARAARQKVKAGPDLVGRVEELLARRVTDLVSLARKAGQAVAGREKVLAALNAGEAALLLQAAGGSARERAEIRPPEGENTRISCLQGHELGMAFGRDRVVHAAVLTGGLADRVKEEALRLSGLRCQNDRRTFGDAGGESVAGEGPRGKG